MTFHRVFLILSSTLISAQAMSFEAPGHLPAHHRALLGDSLIQKLPVKPSEAIADHHRGLLGENTLATRYEDPSQAKQDALYNRAREAGRYPDPARTYTIEELSDPKNWPNGEAKLDQEKIGAIADTPMNNQSLLDFNVTLDVQTTWNRLKESTENAQRPVDGIASEHGTPYVLSN